MYSLQKALWIVGQIIAIIAMAFYGSATIEWLSAIPHEEALSRFGSATPACAMISPPAKRRPLPTCFNGEPIKVHPFLFAGNVLATTSAVLFLYYSSRPRRGLTTRRAVS
jgi:hypothetical protein